MPVQDYIAEIRAGGQRYMLWKSVQVRRDYGDSVSYFQFTACEPGLYQKGWSSLRLKPGDSCQIYLGGIKVIDGSITTRKVAYDATSHDLIIAGKSLTAKAATSSVTIKPGTYDGSTFEQMAKAVLDPLGINLVIQNPPDIVSKPFKNIVVQYGETAHEIIERLARFRGLILTDDADGNYVASQIPPGQVPDAELVEGRNIKSAICTLDNQSAFDRLSGVGQLAGGTDDQPERDVSAAVSNPNGQAGVDRTFVAEHPVDHKDLVERLNYEAARSLWGQIDVSITVVGWKKSDGSLWQPTKNVSVYSPMLFPSEDGSMVLGIQACTYAQDATEGTTTTLDLKRPEALTTRPDPGVKTDNSGDPIDSPNPEQASPDSPDTT